MKLSAIVAFVSASLAFGQAVQNPSQARVFRFAHIKVTRNLNECATMIRSIADIADIAVDTSAFTVTLKGSAAQIAMAEWLVAQVDKPIAEQSAIHDAAIHEFHVPDSANDVLRVFFLSKPRSGPEFQEVATLIRSVAEIRRVFTYNDLEAIAVRGTPDQIAMAAWLYDELDRPAPSPAQGAPAREFRALDGSDDVTRVFYLANARNVAELQETATVIRSLGEIRRLFTYNAPRAIAIRGPERQIMLAAWLLNELDKPLSPQTQLARDSAKHEYRYSGAGDGEVVRIFYMPDMAVQRFQDFAREFRSASNLRRAFILNAQRALAVRGTMGEIAMSEQLIAEKEKGR